MIVFAVSRFVLLAAGHELVAKNIWENWFRLDQTIHLTSMEPDCGPYDAITRVTLSGSGFVSSLENLTSFLEAEKFRFNGIDSLLRYYENSEIPEEFVSSIKYYNGWFESGFRKPSLTVHVNVLEGAYFVAEPQLLSDAKMTFTMKDISRTANSKLAFVSSHLFPFQYNYTSNPLFYKLYEQPEITDFHPKKSSLAGGTNLTLFPMQSVSTTDYNPSLKFSDYRTTKVSTCQVANNKDPLLICKIPPWPYEAGNVTLQLSLNEQNYYNVSSSSLEFTYVDEASILGEIAKQVVEREKEDDSNSPVFANPLAIIQIVDEDRLNEKDDLLRIHLTDGDGNKFILSSPTNLQDVRFDHRLLLDISIMFAGCGFGGLIADIFKLPTVLGYLVSGIVLGPHVSSLIHQIVQIVSFGQIGSALLLFDLGIHFSVSNVLRANKAAFWGGVMAPLVYVCGLILFSTLKGTSIKEGVILGCFLSMSSTTVCVPDISSRRATETHESDVIVSILLVQDVMLGIMLAIIPSLGGKSINLITSLKEFFILLTCLILVIYLISPIMTFIYKTSRSGVYLLITFATIIFFGIFSEDLGMSLEMGALVAGFTLGCLPSQQVEAITTSILPLNYLFSALFFSCIGILLDPFFIVDNLTEIMLVVSALTMGKFMITYLCLITSKYDYLTACRISIMLSHIGEFGFVILSKAMKENILGRKVYLLMVASTGLSLLFSPLLMKLLTIIPHGKHLFNAPVENPIGWQKAIRLLELIFIYVRSKLPLRVNQTFHLLQQQPVSVIRKFSSRPI